MARQGGGVARRRLKVGLAAPVLDGPSSARGVDQDITGHRFNFFNFGGVCRCIYRGW